MIHLAAGPHALLDLLTGYLAEEVSLRLRVSTRAGEGEILLLRGGVRSVRYANRGGLSALVALDVVAEGTVEVHEPALAPDQFGLLPAVILEQARRASAQVQGLAPAPVSALATDAALGTPVPEATTTTDDLLTQAKVTMTVRGDQDAAPAGAEDFPVEFFADLAAEAATATSGQVPAVPAWEPPAIGQMLGKCYLSAEIGRGASAIVYRALQMALKIDVAVKVFVPTDGQAQHLSMREAHVLARLNHPNILRVLDCSEEAPWPHLVMEYVDGSTLADLIEQAGSLPLHTAVPLVLQAARGLAHAHEQGVTHCDVKPGNLLITRRHEVKVADLGVARLALGGDTDAPADGRTVVGTPAYIAPELVRHGIDAAGRASDLYSLGATIYHAVAGEPPFHHDDPVELMVLHVRARAVPLRERVPSVDRELADLVDALLAKEPTERPDYATVISALERIDGRFTRRLKARQATPMYATVRAALRGAVDRLLGRTTRRFSRS